jgi:DTW domain-containing protein YfiP
MNDEERRLEDLERRANQDSTEECERCGRTVEGCVCAEIAEEPIHHDAVY